VLGYHEVLHLTHSAACVVFFLFIVRYVIPFEPPREAVSTVTAQGDEGSLSPVAPASRPVNATRTANEEQPA
jgi:hypothetical protein